MQKFNSKVYPIYKNDLGVKEIKIGDLSGTNVNLGFLDPDQWAIVPWSAGADVNVECTSASTVVEWMLIFE